MENIGAKLVRQAAAKTNDLAGDGTTTSVVLAQGLIAEGVKVCVSVSFVTSKESVRIKLIAINKPCFFSSGCSSGSQPCSNHARN